MCAVKTMHRSHQFDVQIACPEHLQVCRESGKSFSDGYKMAEQERVRQDGLQTRQSQAHKGKFEAHECSYNVIFLHHISELGPGLVETREEHGQSGQSRDPKGLAHEGRTRLHAIQQRDSHCWLMRRVKIEVVGLLLLACTVPRQVPVKWSAW